MRAPRWAQWAASVVVASGLGALLVFRERIIAAAVLSPSSSSARTPANVGRDPSQVVGDPIALAKGLTYFAVLHTTGAVDAAANPDRVKAEAEKQGFRDVLVTRARPASFPGTQTGDYFVRATYAGAPRDVARHQSVFLGSVTLLDVWVAAL